MSTVAEDTSNAQAFSGDSDSGSTLESSSSKGNESSQSKKKKSKKEKGSKKGKNSKKSKGSIFKDPPAKKKKDKSQLRIRLSTKLTQEEKEDTSTRRSK